jgi:hypothetical protein
MEFENPAPTGKLMILEWKFEKLKNELRGIFNTSLAEDPPVSRICDLRELGLAPR